MVANPTNLADPYTRKIPKMKLLLDTAMDSLMVMDAGQVLKDQRALTRQHQANLLGVDMAKDGEEMNLHLGDINYAPSDAKQGSDMLKSMAKIAALVAGGGLLGAGGLAAVDVLTDDKPAAVSPAGLGAAGYRLEIETTD